MEKDKQHNQEDTNAKKKTKNVNDNNEDSIKENISESNDENEEIVNEDIEQPVEEKLKEEISSLKEEKIRVLAEMENLRKRFDREKIDSIKYGSVNFARDMLSPGDNLDRALSSINKDEDHPQSIKNLIEGLLMVKKELSTVLEKNGITKIETLDKKFDPNLHQAMMEIENDDLDEGVIVQEIQTGYLMHDRLLRPAMVGVSKKSKKITASADNEKNDQDEKVSKKTWKSEKKLQTQILSQTSCIFRVSYHILYSQS